METGGADDSPYSCDHLLYVLGYGSKEISDTYREPYKEVFGKAPWWDVRADSFFEDQPVMPEWKDERILALCFMAAMVEAGDA